MVALIPQLRLTRQATQSRTTIAWPSACLKRGEEPMDGGRIPTDMIPLGAILIGQTLDTTMVHPTSQFG